jgi:hypothetical protein
MTEIDSKLYLFIIWEKSRNKTQIILEGLEEKFTIRDVYEIKWSQSKFLNNLRRFYGQSLPDAEEKRKLCGDGPFLVVIVSDTHPRFVKAKVSFKEDLVNMNIHESKIEFRKCIGADFTVHSSISENETNHNLGLLFTKNPKDIESKLPEKWLGEIKKLETDLAGANGWKNMNQLLEVLNWTSKYVILRNFEGIPNNFDYRDIDLLADDEKIVYIVNKDFSPSRDNVRYFETKIGEKKILFNPNFIGDHYYDEQWSKNILKRRILHKNGLYIPCIEDHFYSLLYHVIFHKRWKKMKSISKKYQKMLGELAVESEINEDMSRILNNLNTSKKFLEKYMNKMSYQNTSSLSYKITHNEYLRLVKVAIYLVKTEGIQFLFTAIKLKIKVMIHLN